MKRFVAVAVLAALGLVVGAAAAQDAYPSRPITLVAPFPPGGASEVAYLGAEDFKKFWERDSAALERQGHR